MALLRNYKKLPVEDLIALIADKDQEKQEHDKAIIEFHRRFKNYFFKVCNDTCETKYILDRDEINKLAHDSMRRTYKGFHTFKPTGADIPEKEKVKRVCGWIGVIIHREISKYIDSFDKIKDKIILTENIDDFADYVNSIIDEEEDISPPSPERMMLEEALTLISERDQEITFAYLSHQDENGRIPTEILNRLLKKYKLLPKYPAKIKDRTIKKLIAIINQKPKSFKRNTHVTKTEKSRKKARGKTKRFPPLDRPDDTADTGTG